MRKVAMFSAMVVLGGFTLAHAVPTPTPLPPKGPELSKLLAPKMVRLNLNDASVADAVAELAKQSGYTVQLGGDLAPLANRKVTIQTGDVTFFQALDQLCAKGGLIETNALATNIAPRPGLVRPNIRRFNTNTFVLTDGRPVVTPTVYAGALRIRVAPAGVINVLNQPGETTVVLEVTAEPRLYPFNVNTLPAITKAIDDQGQTLALVNPFANVPGIRPGLNPQPLPVPAPNIKVPQPKAQGQVPAPLPNARPAIKIGLAQPAIAQPAIAQPMIARVNFGLQRYVTIRLKSGEKQAKSIMQLAGTLTVQVQTSEPISIDNVLKAKGQKVSNKTNETSMILDSIDKVGDVYQARVIIEQKVNLPRAVPLPGGGAAPAPGGIQLRPGAQAPAPAPIQIQIQGNAQVQAKIQIQVQPNPVPLPPVQAATVLPFINSGLPVLTDAQGKAYATLIKASNFTPADANGITRRIYTMEYRAAAGQGEPAKLILNQTRMNPVTVPFSFENVPVR